MAEPAGADGESLRLLSYAEFGRRFFALAVTRERVLAAVGDLAGHPIDVGPMGVGPLNLVKVRASGTVGEPAVHPRDDAEHVAYHLTIPARLQMEIQFGLDTYQFDARTAIHLPVTARALEPLRIYIDVQPPSPDDIEVDLQADGVRATVLEKLAGVENEVRRNVARFVREEIDKSRERRIIDVGHKITPQ